MATKKASSSKAAPKKRPATKKPAVKTTTVVAAAAKTGGKKLTFSDKVKALKPGALIAEFFGTFVLAGAVISLFGAGLIGSIAVALIVTTLVVVFGVVSGPHLNPAITIAQYVNRKVDGVKTVAYIFAQVLGALAAFGLLIGLFNASSNLKSQVFDALVSDPYANVTADDIDKGGGIEKYIKDNYDLTIDDAVQNLGLVDAAAEVGLQSADHKMTADKEWVNFLLELLGSVVFGLGIGYAVCATKKNQIETGLAVGVSLLAGLVIGGATVILNPAVAAAIGGFDWANPFGVDAMTFWWPVFTYIGATVIGITAGFSIYRLALSDAKK
ncbi:aquaporin [Candidatus Saccharibacteria bacterium]|nr:aquaporin [Candidatus Saccharibacteria bacterium]